MSDDLKGQVALVTGASSGIGRAIAVRLAVNGAHVCLVARRRHLLDDTAVTVRAAGGSASVHPRDLLNDSDLQSLVREIERSYQRVDLLVLCGGAIAQASFTASAIDDLDLQYRSNVRAHYALTQLALPLLRQSKGQVAFVNSSTGLKAKAGAAQYSATQHALRAIADSLRDEVNAEGIRVLTVYVGRTATPRTARLFEQEGRHYAPELLLQPEDVAAMVAHALTMPRTAEVTEISIRPMLNANTAARSGGQSSG